MLEKSTGATGREVDVRADDELSKVAHDLCSPLTGLIGYLVLLADDETGPLTATQLRIVERAARNVQRLAYVVENLLGVATVGAGRNS